jgi:hypothetical protein
MDITYLQKALLLLFEINPKFKLTVIKCLCTKDSHGRFNFIYVYH